MKLTRTVTLQILDHVHKYALLIFGANLPWLEMFFMLCLIVSEICVCVLMHTGSLTNQWESTLFTKFTQLRGMKQGVKNKRIVLCSSFLWIDVSVSAFYIIGV